MYKVKADLDSYGTEIAVSEMARGTSAETFADKGLVGTCFTCATREEPCCFDWERAREREEAFFKTRFVEATGDRGVGEDGFLAMVF